MIQRRKTKTATVGNIKIGTKWPIRIQSMTKTFTTDVEACIRQIKSLNKAGCDLIRIAVPTKADTDAFKQIVNKTSLPLIADIHFSKARAIEAIEAGAAKIRLNPGNIQAKKDIIEILSAAKYHGTAIRIGINEASIRDLKKGDTAPKIRTNLMLKEMKEYVKLFEKENFTNIVLSAKSADTLRTIEINRALAKAFEYPLHLGLTHSGLPEDGTIPSSVAIGGLLSEGIGDTIRVSLAGNPVEEVKTAQNILKSLDLFDDNKPRIIVCPTCGRCQIDVVKLAKKVKKAVQPYNTTLRIAVMGCIVNGPGEAADADLAICAGKGKGYIYKAGKRIDIVKEEQLLDRLLTMIEKQNS